MSIEQIIKNEVYKTESGKELFALLSKLKDDKRAVENMIILLKTEKNRQKMIKFLQKGETDLDRIAYYVAELNRGIKLL